MNAISTLWEKARSIFRWPWMKDDAPPPISSPVPQPSAPIARPRPVDNRGEEVTAAGRFYFRDDILDRLDDYFHYAKQMKSYDPQSYSFYRRVGATICTEGMRVKYDNLPASWRAGLRPTFGAFTTLTKAKDLAPMPDGDIAIPPRFSYFEKQERGEPGVERLSGDWDYYRVVTWYKRTTDDDDKMSMPSKYHVALSRDGAHIRLLRYHYRGKTVVPGGNRHRRFTIPQSWWGYPTFIEDVIRDNRLDWTPEKFAARHFAEIATAVETVGSDIRIMATKDNVSAVFSVDLLRTPYFFKDRDVRVNARGNRRRIFHVVRPHERHTAAGKIVVKNHFRGERAFGWNGYDILITLPGLHHADLGRFDGATLAVPDGVKKPDGMMTPAQLGKYVRRHIETGGDPKLRASL